MSDVVLARKYRPRSFAQMVGQPHVVQALGNALTSGRLHHAYLFTGTRGIGKTTVSRILAKSLNCTGPDGQGGVTAEPCGVCQACTEIDADRFIDYIELDAASNRGIDEVRDLIERATYKPSVGRYKVFMIDEAHQLTKEAFNALLKTLEEPPDYLKFVLATTDPDKMLPTVLSRCLQFNLRPMAPETVLDHLRTVLDAERVPADAGALRLLSRAARGSMRDALSLTDQAIAFGAGQLDEAGVRAMLGTVDRSHAFGLVQALARRDGPSVLAIVDSLRQLGLSAAGTLEEMAALLQQMAVQQAVPGALDAQDPDTAGAVALAAEMPADETQLLYSIVVHGRAELSLVSDDHAGLTMVLLRLLAFAPAGAAATPPVAGAVPPQRAAPLVAAPRQARINAPVRPVTPLVAAASPSPSPSAAPLPAGVVERFRPGPTQVVTQPQPQPQPQALSVQEPPPWIDDPLPDEDALSAAAGQAPDVPVEAGPASADAPAVAKAPAMNDHAPPAPPAGAVPVAFKRTALGDQWAALIRPLVADGSITAMARELALQAELLATRALDGGGHEWHLCVEREPLRSAALAAKLGAALEAALGQPVRLRVEAGVAADAIARRDAMARDQAQAEAESTIQADPAVRELMAQFRTARIVPGSIKPLSAERREPRNSAP